MTIYFVSKKTNWNKNLVVQNLLDHFLSGALLTGFKEQMDYPLRIKKLEGIVNLLKCCFNYKRINDKKVNHLTIVSRFEKKTIKTHFLI